MTGADFVKEMQKHRLLSGDVLHVFGVPIEKYEVLQKPDFSGFFFGWKANGIWHQMELTEDAEITPLLVALRMS